MKPARPQRGRWFTFAAAFTAIAAVAASGPVAWGGAPQPVAGRAVATAHPHSARHGAADAVLFWNEAAGRAAVASCIAPVDDPLTESHMYAMTHLAIHDALNAIAPRYGSYARPFRAQPGASPTAAVAAAAHDVLISTVGQIPAPFSADCVSAGLASVESDYQRALDELPVGWATDEGLAAGRRAAARIIDARSADGSDTPLVVADYPQGTQPGEWRFTPDRPFAFAPGWGDVTPFALRSAGQFRSGPPYDLHSSAYAADLAEVERLGGDGVTTPSARTPWQTETAMFWVESSPLAWNRLAREVVGREHADGWATARVFAQLNMAMADGYVGSFDEKYDYGFWRPVTAIREAGHDGNPVTVADPTWTPLTTTPPIPDHDSAHAVEGGAATEVLRVFLGTDHIVFSACSLTVPTGTCGNVGEVRHYFNRLSQAAEQNADSRVWVGFHFRHASEDGLAHGRLIGRWTASHTLPRLR